MATIPKTITEAKALLEGGSLTALSLMEQYLEVLAKDNPDINAYREVFADAREQAIEADQKRKEGNKGRLLGIPLAIKDNILIEGKHAGASSKILENYVATYDATAIKKLKAEGAIFIGRTNMDEFAMGGSTENSAYGVTRNPHDRERVSGGSSGGSAAAVAMGGALAALGSDTGGSVRQPASFCGLVGLKPTYGAISRFGLMAMGSSLDQIGPMTTSVADAELLFDILKGEDPQDSTSLSDSLYEKAQVKSSYTIGVPWHFLEKGLSEEVLLNFKEAINRFKALGCEVRDIELPNIDYSLPVYYIIMPAESSTNLARFDGVRYGLHVESETLLDDYKKSRGEGFGQEVRRRILLGTYVLSAGYYDAYYYKALQVRELIKQDFKKVFDSGVDVVLTPTTPAPAFKIGEKIDDPVTMYLADIFTTPANIAGIPALSVPSGFAAIAGKQLPLGVQLMGAPLTETTLFDMGKKFLGEA
jgi:aspartyl-tRNA(Asn)/glutamyl-tRNA(Gln) amidotransferase subunit A